MDTGGDGSVALLPPPSRSPSPELLSSDEEGVPPTIPMTLRPLPHYVPPLPPKHTYLRTPVSTNEIVGFIYNSSCDVDISAQESCITVAGEETQERRSRARVFEEPAARDRRQHDRRCRTTGSNSELGSCDTSAQTLETIITACDLILHRYHRLYPQYTVFWKCHGVVAVHR